MADLRQERRCTHKPCHVHVVTAGMHHGHRYTFAVGAGYSTGKGQAGGFQHRKGIHVGSHHFGRNLAVAKKSYAPRFPQPRGYIESGGAETIGSDARDPLSLNGKLGVGVNVSIGGLQVWEKRIQWAREDRRCWQRDYSVRNSFDNLYIPSGQSIHVCGLPSFTLFGIGQGFYSTPPPTPRFRMFRMTKQVRSAVP